MGEQKPNWFENFTLFMDQNIRGIQYGVYSIAIVGLAVSLRSVRPFKKFSQPKEIPSSFIEKHLTLRGKAVGVEPSCGSSPAYLLVDHSPIISIAWLRPRKPHLPIEISGVNLTPNGLSWLQHVVVGSPVKFTILKVNSDAVYCIVNKKNRNVGLDLVSLGFASVSPLDFTLEKDTLYMKYYKKLITAENRAEKKGHGIWANEKNKSRFLLPFQLSKQIGSAAVFALRRFKEALSKPTRKNSSHVVAAALKSS